MRSVLTLLLGLLLAVVVPPAALAAEPHQPATILVKFTNPAAAATVIRQQGDRHLARTLGGVDVVRTSAGADLARKLAAYERHPAVEFAELNYVATMALAPPSDPSFANQWAYGKIRGVDGWGLYPGSYASTGGAPVAIVDTGVETTHPDFGGRVLTGSGADCVNGANTCNASAAGDDNGHGTHVAGIAAASTNNGVGGAGTAFSSPIIPVKVLNASGSGTYAAIANGILWAAQKGARVINLSLGGASYSQTLCDAVTTATFTYGTLVVAAAGNNASSTAFYPASCAGTVGVSATTSSDTAASFTNYGSPNVFVSAPGASILSTYLNGGYATLSGTSMASPFVAGLAALLVGQQSSRTPAQLRTILATTSAKVGGGYGADPYGTCGGCTWSAYFGYGRIDMYAALALAGSPTPSFTLGVSPDSRSVSAGASTTYSVVVSPSGGFSGSVTFSASGLPAGATASFSPTSSTSSSTLSVQTSASTPAGSYTLAITGTSGSLVQSATATLVVGAQAPDFSVSATPASRTVTQGGTTSYDVAATLVGGFPYHVRLTVVGLPAGATGTFSPEYTMDTSVLTVATSGSTPAGSYPLTITGTANGLTRTTTVTLVVDAQAPAPDFALNVTPSNQVLYRGESVTFTVSVVPSNGFSGAVTLAASGLPPDTTATFSPNPTAGSATLTVSASATAKFADYTVTITGTSGGLSRSKTVQLILTHR